MAHNIETVTELIEKKAKPFWYVYEGGNLINFNSDESNPAKGAQELRDFLEGKTGTYDIVITDFSKETSSGRKPGTADLKLRVKLTSDTQGPITGPPQVITGNSDREIKLLEQIADLKRQLIETEYKQQITGLQEQINALKTGGNNPILEMAITQLLPLFAGSNNQAAATAPVLHGNEDQAEKENQKAALSAILKRLMKADNDYINTLDMVTTFAEQKPEQYKSFKPILKSQING